MLKNAPVVTTLTDTLIATVPSLRVTGRCGCRCASVDFGQPADKPSTRLADGTGATDEGVAVGEIVWGDDQAITSLEIYTLGDGTGSLPTLDSLRAWDG